MGMTTFSGPIRSENGFITGTDSAAVPLGIAATPVNSTGTTLAVTAADHSGKLVTINRAAGTAITLPAATGSGNIYRFFIGTTISSNSTTIKVANASDTMIGFVLSTLAAGGTTFGESAGGTDDTITMNGTTTGGIAGSYVELRDQAANLWFVKGFLAGSGTLASSLSATVS